MAVSGRRLLVPLLALAVLSGCGAPRAAPSELARGWVDGMAPAGEGAYRPPTDGEAEALAEGLALASLPDPDAAREVLAPAGYGLEVFREDGGTSGEDDQILVLGPDGPGVAARGWGWAAHRRGGDSRLVVEVPHPLADIATEDVGAELFSRAGARALLVAGAHRRAAPEADVPDEEGSVLQAWQQALVTEGDVVVQVHGFDRDSYPDRYGEVVVSDGAAAGGEPGRVSERVALALEDAGFSVCLQHRDDCDQLAGTRNVQGRAAREAGASFVHLELARSLRSDPTEREAVVEALVQALGSRG